MSAAAGLAARLAAGSRRLRDSLPAILQITVTAVAAYAFAYFVLGHDEPLIAAMQAKRLHRNVPCVFVAIAQKRFP